MRKRRLISLVLFSIMLAATTIGCSNTSAEEPTAAAPASLDDGEEPTSGLATVSPVGAEEESTESRITATVGVTRDDSEESEVEETEGEEDNAQPRAAVTPVVVDLRKVTPQAPAANSTPRVMPGPGIPNPSAAASNRAAIDLAGAMNVDVGEVEVVTIEPVQWRDGSLGCPQPGRNYPAVITPGFRIILEVDGDQVEYHTNLDGTVLVQCSGDARLPIDTADR